MPMFARRHGRRHGIWVCAVLLVRGPLALAGESLTSEWPCIQHKVPEITAGMMWAGPEIDARDRRGQESPAIAPLAYRLAQRRLPIEEAVNEIDAMITHTLPLDDINKGFDLMHSGESIRSVVLYD